MTRRRLNPRERLLLLVALPVCVLALYASLRVKIQARQVALVKEGIADLRKDLEEARRRRRLRAAAAVSEAKLEALRQELDNLRGELEALHGLRVAEADPEALQTLILEILDAARGAALNVEAAGMAREDVQIPELKRPVYQLSLTGDYPRVLTFIQALGGLSYRVDLLGFSLRAEGEGYPRPVHCDLELLL